MEYARFLVLVTPKKGDTVKELRKLSDRETNDEIVEMLRKRGVTITP
ncbi:MAG: hypothetical protein V3T58_01490 [Candidatus Hydrothermarchaeales archaeon]